MFEQAAGFALLAALSPTAMLMAAVFLVSARPGRLVPLFVAGGLLVVTVIGTGALLAMRAGGLSDVGQQHTRYGLRLALGVVAVAAAVVIARRRPGTPEQAKQKKPGVVARMSARPTPLTAFAVGVVIFGPGLTFIAAVQVVASANASPAATAGAMAMIVVLVTAFAWLPLVAYLFAPDATVRILSTANDQVRRNGKKILAAAVGTVGVLLIAQGIYGLV